MSAPMPRPSSSSVPSYDHAELHNFLEIECPDDYAALPPASQYEFRTWTYPAHSAPQLKPRNNRLLHVGRNNEGGSIYAYLTRDSVALNIGYDGVRPTAMGRITQLQLKAPFRYLNSNQTKFKALVNFIFLAAGEVTRVNVTTAWKQDLRRACAWVESKGSRPLSLNEKNNRKFRKIKAQEYQTRIASSDLQLATPVTGVEQDVSILPAELRVKDSEPSIHQQIRQPVDELRRATPNITTHNVSAKRRKLGESLDRIMKRRREDEAEFANIQDELTNLDPKIFEDQIKCKDDEIEKLKGQLEARSIELKHTRSLLRKEQQQRGTSKKEVETLKRRVEDLVKEKTEANAHRNDAEARLKNYVDTQVKLLASYKG